MERKREEKCDHDEYSDDDNDEKELEGKEYYSLLKKKNSIFVFIFNFSNVFSRITKIFI